MTKLKLKKRASIAPTDEVRAMIAKGDDVSTIAAALKVPKHVVYNQRNAMKKKGKLPTKKRKATKTKMIEVRPGSPAKSTVEAIATLRPDLTFRVPDAGIVLKMHNGRHIIGTLVVTPNGLRYSPNKAKKHPPREMPWTALHSLMTSGLLS